jgi:pimeloyl-ACP methyl ester carboxylesterase
MAAGTWDGYWHLAGDQLRRRGHEVVAPDLPCDDDSAGLGEYADTVVDAIADRRNVVVVAQSYGGFTAPLVAERLGVDLLVLVAGMIPAPGKSPAQWWDNTGYQQAVREQAERDGGQPSSEDPFVTFYHDVPRALAEEAMQGAGRIGDRLPHPVATGSLVGCSDQVRAVHSRPLLPT